MNNHILHVNSIGKCRLEKEVQEKIGRIYKHRGYFYYKLSDANMLSYKPYDYIVVDLEGNTYHCELKMVKSASFNISALRNQQHASLESISNKGGNAVIQFYSLKTHQVITMTWDSFRAGLDKAGKIKLF